MTQSEPALAQLTDPFLTPQDSPTGTLPGAFDVNEFGVPTYTVKLSVPPGTNGMVPELSLNYGSANLRGMLGPRWALTGLPSISRCPMIPSIDGTIEPVDFKSSDRFCLDGQRLVAVTGSYGANGTIYRTTTETFSRITSLGQIGSGPEKWTVEYKNGLTAEIGFNDDARAKTAYGTDVFSWFITRMSDRSGNSLDVQYYNDAAYGDVVPLRIDYTSNPSAGLAPYNSVQFEYHLDPIPHSNFIGGSNFWSRLHLSSIKMYEGTNLAWAYNMQWQMFSDTQREQLVGIQECGGSGACLPATTFEWNKGIDQGIDFQSPYSSPILSENQGFIGGDDFPLITGDWDGDGKQDIGRAQNGGVYLYKSTGSGWVSFASTFTGPNSPGTKTWKHFPLFAGDWNADGRTDIGRVTSIGGQTHIDIYLTSASGTLDSFMGINIPYYILSSQPLSVGVGVFNSTKDGRNGIVLGYRGEASPIIWGAYDSVYGTWANLGGGIPGDPCEGNTHCPTRIGDFNGDGLSDIVIPGIHGTYFYISHGGYFTHWYTLNELSEAQGYLNSTDYPFFVGDWNGDGLSDVARIGPNGIRFCRSFGSQVGACTNSPFFGSNNGYSSSIQHPLLVADMNRDGITDIGRVGQGGVTFYKTEQIENGTLNQPSLLPDLSPPTYSPGSQYPMAMGDFNGDGLPDIARVGAAGLVTYLRQPNQAGQIHRIINGLGAEIEIEYKNLTDGTVYTKGSAAQYPDFDTQPSSFVVSKVSYKDSSGNISTISYVYKALRGANGSNGLTGFEYIVELSNTGLQTKTWYHTNGEFRGLPYAVEIFSQTGLLISRKSDTWAKYQTYPNVTFPYIASTFEDRKDLDGTPIGTVTINNSYDSAWGNLTNQTINRSDGSFEKTVNTYNNDSIHWLIGSVTQSVVSKRLPNNATETDRHISFDYNALGQVTIEYVEKANPALEQRKEYIYDSFGNITATLNVGVLASSRSETKQYDSKGRFVTKAINALGHETLYEYDSRHGLPTKTTDPNGLEARTLYDDFGRVLLTATPDGLITRKLTLQSGAGSLPGSTYYERIDSQLAPPVFVYFDSLGRELQRRSTGFDGRDVVVDKVYDDRGDLTQQSDPYFVGDPILWTVFDYDDLGRVTTETAPGNRITYTIYNGKTTTVVNPLNQSSTKTVDQLGLLQSSTDHYGNTTTYKYNNHGDMIEVTDALGNVTSMLYDVRGRKLSISDPNTGTTTYGYDGFGQLLSQTNSLNQTVTYQYDLLGRISSRTSPEGTEYWQYDSTAHAIGRLSEIKGLNGYQQIIHYDQLSRPIETITSIAGQDYSIQQSYDSLSRLAQLRYPTGFAVRRIYNKNGFLSEIVRNDNGKLLWKAQAYNAGSQPLQQELGNGLQTIRGYDANTGYLTSIVTGAVQNLSFTFNPIGNLTQRRDNSLNLYEDFQYDGLNRLTSSQVTAQGSQRTAVTTSYDAIGNILSRSDVGTYLYGQNGFGPHAVTSITGAKPNTYTYDAAGNRVTSNSGAALYNSLGKVTKLSDGANILEFDLSPDHQRIQQRVFKAGQLIETKDYIGKLFEHVVKGQLIEDLHYIENPEGAFAIYSTRRSSLTGSSTGIGGAMSIAPRLVANHSIKYLLTDHLGSVQTITDGNGIVTEVLSFDAWGNRREATTWDSVSNTLKSGVDRGFTGHEQLDEVGLIHMNGRVYDPVIGRFLSADPIVQSPENMQSLNRYSYVLNNPLSLVDPSGYFSFKKLWKSIKKFLPTAASLAVAVFLPQLVITPYLNSTWLSCVTWGGTAITGISGAATGFAASMTGNLLSGGGLGQSFKASLKGLPLSAARAIVAFQIGESASSGFLNDNFGGHVGLARAVTHGLAGGATGAVQGQRFKAGFLGGFAGTFGDGQGALGSILAGGTAAALGGGKFKDGALQAAFQYVYNYCAHPRPTTVANWNGAWGSSSSGGIGVAMSCDPEPSLIDLFIETYRSASFEDRHPTYVRIVKGVGIAATASLGFTLTAGMGAPVWLTILNNASTYAGWTFTGGPSLEDLVNHAGLKGVSKFGGQWFGSVTGGGKYAADVWKGHVNYGKAIYKGIDQQDQ